jgi:hypothetical protein
MHQISMLPSCLKCIGFLVAFLGILAAPLAAQFSSGFEGTVTDASGASVGGADVTVTDLSTGVPQRTKTSDSGTFRIQRLSPGTIASRRLLRASRRGQPTTLFWRPIRSAH